MVPSVGCSFSFPSTSVNRSTAPCLRYSAAHQGGCGAVDKNLLICTLTKQILPEDSCKKREKLPTKPALSTFSSSQMR